MTPIPLFHSPGRVVTLDDVLHAAELRGDVPAEERPGPTLDDAAAESASEDWRIEKNLIAGEELDVWLALRHITHDDFLRHFRGEAPANETQRLARWWIDGSITRWATRHAHAIAALAARTTPPAPETLRDCRLAVMERLGGEASLQTWMIQRRLDACWLQDFCQIEAAYEECRVESLQGPGLERELRNQHFQLHRIRVCVCEAPDLASAREMLLQLHAEPAARLADKAAQAGMAVRELRLIVADVPSHLQQPLLSTRVGECLPPQPHGDVLQLCQVLEKTPPSLDDAEVLRRIEKHVLNQSFTERCEPVVRWLVGEVT